MISDKPLHNDLSTFPAEHMQRPGGKLRPGITTATVIQQQGPAPSGAPPGVAMSQGSPAMAHQLSPMGSHQRIPSNEALAGHSPMHHQSKA